jgi:hypothetical protein
VPLESGTLHEPRVSRNKLNLNLAVVGFCLHHGDGRSFSFLMLTLLAQPLLVMVARLGGRRLLSANGMPVRLARVVVVEDVTGAR